MKKKLILIISLSVVVVLLGVVYALAAPSLSTDVSETTSRPQYDEDGDFLGTSGRPFMYPNISRSDVQDITVTNQYGTYKAYRYGTTFYFEGVEELSYDREMFSSLVVNATFTLAMRKIKFDTYVYEDFGLTEDLCNAIIEVNTIDKSYHKIIIGDKLANGGGYYAKYEGKDFIYVLDTTLEESVLLSLEDYLTPWLVYPITATDYLDITKLYYTRNGSPYFAARNATQAEQESTGNVFATLYPNDKEYRVSSYLYSEVLQSLTQLQGKKVLEYGLYPLLEPELEDRKEDESDEDYNARVEKYNQELVQYQEDSKKYTETLNKYNIAIEGKGHTVLYTYEYPVTDSDGNETGETLPTDFYLDISEKTANNTYYVYSMYFGMIAEVPYSTLYWLEWDITRFLDQYMFSMNINNVSKITASFGGNDYIFSIYKDSEGVATSVYAGNNEYNMDAFRQFYITVLEFRINGRTEMPAYDVPVMKLLIETDTGNYEYVFYMKTTRKVFYTLNGEGEFYVSVDKVLQLQREAIAIYNGELIE